MEAVANYSGNLLRDLEVWYAMAYVSLGVWVWEMGTGPCFLVQVALGNFKWRWTMLAYMIGRITTSLFMSLIIYQSHPGHEIDCQQTMTAILVFAGLAITIASGSLMLRAIAVWNRNLFVSAFCAVGFLAQLAVVFWNAFSDLNRSARYNHELKTCLIESASSRGLQVYCFITVVVDGVILLLTLGRLLKIRLDSGVSFGLTRVIMRDGGIYFLVSFVWVLATALLNSVHVPLLWHFMLLPPTVVFCQATSGRVYVNLLHFVCPATREGQTTNRDHSHSMPLSNTYMGTMGGRSRRNTDADLEAGIDGKDNYSHSSIEKIGGLPNPADGIMVTTVSVSSSEGGVQCFDNKREPCP